MRPRIQINRTARKTSGGYALDNGALITLNPATGLAYDPVTGAEITPTADDVTITGINYKPIIEALNRYNLQTNETAIPLTLTRGGGNPYATGAAAMLTAGYYAWPYIKQGFNYLTDRVHVRGFHSEDEAAPDESAGAGAGAAGAAPNPPQPDNEGDNDEEGGLEEPEKSKWQRFWERFQSDPNAKFSWKPLHSYTKYPVRSLLRDGMYASGGYYGTALGGGLLTHFPSWSDVYNTTATDSAQIKKSTTRPPETKGGGKNEWEDRAASVGTPSLFGGYAGVDSVHQLGADEIDQLFNL